MIRKAGAGTAALGGSLALLREKVGRDNFDRSVSFYKVAIPGYIIYKVCDFKTRGLPQEQRGAKFALLHAKWAPKALDKILELRGFYIKTGQMAASNVGNAFPDTWVRTMEVLQDRVPHKDFATVRCIIEEAYGGRALEEVFSSFDHEPIGAASIGQAHRATVAEPTAAAASAELASSSSSSSSSPSKAVTGGGSTPQTLTQQVVVKVQYPEVEGRFRGDVRTLINFCKVAQPEHVKALQEIERQFASEFDYRLEAANLAEVKRNLSGPFPNVVVPSPLVALCTSKVLVMEDLSPCCKLADGLRSDVAKLASLLGTSVSQLEASEREKFNAMTALGRARRGPSAVEMDALIAGLAAKVTAQNATSRAWNWVASALALPFRLLPSALQPWPPPLNPKLLVDLREVVPLNPARVVDDLLAVHGHEILVDGCFNGDPHPGNLLLVHSQAPNWSATRQQSNSGPQRGWWRWLRGGRSTNTEKDGSNVGLYTGGDRLGLIDYGQVKRLDLDARLRLARLLVALNLDGREVAVRRRVANALHAMGHTTKHNRVDTAYTLAKLVYDSNDEVFSKGRHVQQVLDELQRQDPVETVAEEYVLVGRVCALLRGLGFVLRQPRSTAVAWLPFAKQLLVEAGEWDPEDDARIEKQRRRVEIVEAGRRQEESERVLESRREKKAGLGKPD